MSNLLKQILVVVVLVAAVIGTSWALWSPELFRAHDYIHAARISELVRSASDGQWPVHWSANFGFGYGMPLFLYYAPLPYYVAGFWYWLTGSIVFSVKSLFFIANLGTILGGFYLGRRLSGSRLIGLVVALAFGLAPYRALNLFVRGAVSEAWGMMALVWMWYGLVGVLTPVVKNFAWRSFFSSSWWWVVFGAVIVLLSHNLTSLMVFPLTAVLVVIWFLFKLFRSIGQKNLHFKILRKEIVWKISQLGSALALALSLSSFYLLPAFFEKNLVALESILGGYFDFRQHFLYIRQFFDSTWGYGGSTWGPDDEISFFVGFPILILGAALAVLLITKIKNLKNLMPSSTREWQVWWLSFALIALLSLFLTLMHAKPLWLALPLIDYIQFPWRFLAISSLGLSLTAGLGLLFFQGKLRLILGLIMIIAALWQSSFFRPEFWLDDHTSLYYTDQVKIRSHMSEILPDYLPSGLKIGGEGGLEPHMSDHPLLLEEQIGVSQLLINHSHQKLFTIKVDEPTLVTLAIADFPNWRVEIDGVPISHQVTDQGLIAIDLDEGSWQVGVFLTNTPLRTAGNLISLVSLVAVFAIIITSRLKNVGESQSDKQK